MDKESILTELAQESVLSLAPMIEQKMMKDVLSLSTSLEMKIKIEVTCGELSSASKTDISKTAGIIIKTDGFDRLASLCYATKNQNGNFCQKTDGTEYLSTDPETEVLRCGINRS